MEADQKCPQQIQLSLSTERRGNTIGTISFRVKNYVNGNVSFQFAFASRKVGIYTSKMRLWNINAV